MPSAISRSMQIPPEQGLFDLLGKYAEGAGKQTAAELKTEIKNLLKDLLNKHNFGFTTSENTANALGNINHSDKFKRLKDCVGSHWALDLIRVGLHIADLNEDGQRQLVKEMKSEVFKKYGSVGEKIINMGSTRAINPIVEYLSELKLRENLPQAEMAKELEHVIREWDRITVFVKKESDSKEIKIEISKHINSKQLLFFVFSYGEAAYGNASRAIAGLSNDKQILQNGYVYFLKPSYDSLNCKIFSWTFKLCSAS